MRVAICSLAGDLHALRVWEALTERHGVACELVEIDRLVGRAFTWELERRADAIVPALGNELRLAEVDAVWWRRTSRGQIGTDCLDPIAREVIDVSWPSAMLGAFETAYGGAWISRPSATLAADNKLAQLAIANEVGLSVPETLVTTNPRRAKEFAARFDGAVVAKALRSTPRGQLATIRVTEEVLAVEPAIETAPTIWQRRIEGTRHLRVCFFGSHIVSAVLMSDLLDWRHDRELRAIKHNLDAEVGRALSALLDRFGLRMGVFDLKLDDDGRPWWLELNAQGQFLFLENIGALDLLTPFCEFLVAEASSADKARVCAGATLTGEAGVV